MKHNIKLVGKNQGKPLFNSGLKMADNCDNETFEWNYLKKSFHNVYRYVYLKSLYSKSYILKTDKVGFDWILKIIPAEFFIMISRLGKIT